MNQPATSITKKFIGEVLSQAGTNTVAIKVGRVKTHPKYVKRYQVQKRYLADTGSTQYEKGDIVEIEQTRPLSKRKQWRVVGKVK